MPVSPSLVTLYKEDTYTIDTVNVVNDMKIRAPYYLYFSSDAVEFTNLDIRLTNLTIDRIENAVNCEVVVDDGETRIKIIDPSKPSSGTIVLKNKQ